MPPARANKSPKKAPPASPKPMTPSRSSTRKVTTPSRLGVDDGFGIGAASKWTSEDAGGAAKTPSAKAAAAEKSVPSAFSVGAADVLTLGGGVAAWFYMMQEVAAAKGKPLMGAPTVSGSIGIALAVALPQLLYVYVWNKPATFKKWCTKGFLKPLGKKPVKTFEKLVLLGKAIQQLSLLLWAFYFCGKITTLGGAKEEVIKVLTATPLNQRLCAALLIVVGQVLNVAIYRAIGANGVYYGFKLGAPVPWSTAFPFSAGFRHPQYVGGYLTQIGVLLLLANAATINAGLVPLACWWFVTYAVNSIVEASGDADQ